MDVGFGVVGDIVVDDVGDAGHVKAAGGDIGCNHDVLFTALEVLNGLLSLTLVQVAVQRRHGVAAGRQLLGQQRGFRLGAHEYDSGIDRLNFEDAGQGIQLALGIDRQHELGNPLDRAGFTLDLHFRCVAQIGLGNLLDLRGHGGGEQCALAVLRRLGEDGFDIVDEAHAEHFIGLVQHQSLEFIQLQGALAQVVEQAAWCADNDLRTAPQSLDLGKKSCPP